jgi:hypothetical protein
MHKTGERVRERVLELRRTKYDGFNDQHCIEKLLAIEWLVISRATIQRMLRAAGIGSPRKGEHPNAVDDAIGGCARVS